MTHGLHHFILRMGLEGGVARWYWTTISHFGLENQKSRLQVIWAKLTWRQQHRYCHLGNQCTITCNKI